MFSISSRGDFSKTSSFLKKLSDGSIYSDLNFYGRLGIRALEQATPVDTALTQRSWRFRIIKDKKHPGIEWYNTNVVDGIPVVILIQYGHGTGTGGYVEGRDFINPAMHHVFDQIANDVWKKVKSA